MSLYFGIFGCGPSGLMAAHAVEQAGFEPIIYSIKKRSRQYGAQWLHSHIPEITPKNPQGKVHYFLRGKKRVYSDKVYGNPNAPSSFGEFEQDQPAWNLREAYEKLWDKFEEDIVNLYVDRQTLKDMIEQRECDAWVSTMPREDFCLGMGVHEFESQPVWATVTRSTDKDGYENWVEYSGERGVDWYRRSSVFGHSTMEFPFTVGQEPPDRGWLLKKPLFTDCDCWPEVFFSGRYGRWKKGVLTDHVYHDVRNRVKELTGV